MATAPGSAHHEFRRPRTSQGDLLHHHAGRRIANHKDKEAIAHEKPIAFEPSHSSSLALILALVLWVPVHAQSAAPDEGKMMTEPHHAMTESQQAMQCHQAMMADLTAEDAELTAQVAKMNSAPADKKLDLLAIVTRLVEQRTAMTARIGMMRGEIMQHGEMGKESMPEHSIMKDMDEKSGDAKK
jgi:hypothetical protein